MNKVISILQYFRSLNCDADFNTVLLSVKVTLHT